MLFLKCPNTGSFADDVFGRFHFFFFNTVGSVIIVFCNLFPPHFTFSLF